jgi:hypothetical protein
MLEIARRVASDRADIVVPRSQPSVTVPPASEQSSQTLSTEGLSSGVKPPASHAPALIIAAPFSAIMIVGAFVFVELTAGITEASMTRSPSMPCRSWSSTP